MEREFWNEISIIEFLEYDLGKKLFKMYEMCFGTKFSEQAFRNI